MCRRQRRKHQHHATEHHHARHHHNDYESDDHHHNDHAEHYDPGEHHRDHHRRRKPLHQLGANQGTMSMAQYSPSHTPDPLDAAAEIDALSRDAAVARIRSLQKPGQRSEHCQECGEAIAHERIQAVPGVKYCVNCANALERKAARGLRGATA